MNQKKKKIMDPTRPSRGPCIGHGPPVENLWSKISKVLKKTTLKVVNTPPPKRKSVFTAKKDSFRNVSCDWSGLLAAAVYTL